MKSHLFLPNYHLWKEPCKFCQILHRTATLTCTFSISHTGINPSLDAQHRNGEQSLQANKQLLTLSLNNQGELLPTWGKTCLQSHLQQNSHSVSLAWQVLHVERLKEVAWRSVSHKCDALLSESAGLHSFKGNLQPLNWPHCSHSQQSKAKHCNSHCWQAWRCQEKNKEKDLWCDVL